MKLLHLIENLDKSYGGPARSVPLLIKNLNYLNITNKLFTVQIFKNECNDTLENNNIDVIKVPLEGMKKIKYSSILKEKIIHEITKDTIIHVHTLWTYPTYVGYTIAKKYNLPLVVSLRGTMYNWALNQNKLVKKIAMLLFQRAMLNYADAIHITEPNEKKALEDIGIFNKTVFIPNGVELENKFDSLNKDILEKFTYNKNKRYIMFLGRIVHNKGLHYLINSFKTIEAKYPDVNILIVGGIEDKAYFKTLEKKDKIYFLGSLEGIEKHTIFSISNLFILPSYTENFGMAIAEAMSYGLPVITTTGTPWKEIKDQDAGWWVELNQQNIDIALEEALSFTTQQLKEKGYRGHEIIKNYTLDIQAQKMKQCYEEILHKKGNR